MVERCALVGGWSDLTVHDEGDSLAIEEIRTSLELHQGRLAGDGRVSGLVHDDEARGRQHVDVADDDAWGQLRFDHGVAALADIGGARDVNAPGERLIVTSGRVAVGRNHDREFASVLGPNGSRRQCGRTDNDGEHERERSTQP